MSLQPPFGLPLTLTLLTLVWGLITYFNLVALHFKVWLIIGFQI